MADFDIERWQARIDAGDSLAPWSGKLILDELRDKTARWKTCQLLLDRVDAALANAGVRTEQQPHVGIRNLYERYKEAFHRARVAEERLAGLEAATPAPPAPDPRDARIAQLEARLDSLADECGAALRARDEARFALCNARAAADPAGELPRVALQPPASEEPNEQTGRTPSGAGGT